MAKSIILVLLFAVLVSTAPALARMQENSQEPSASTSPAETQSADDEKKEKRGEWVAAPIPISSPAIGSGLAWAVGYIFPIGGQDENTPSSAVGVGGLFTNNGSRGVAVGGRLYLKNDKYRVTGVVGDAKINADIYGIGKISGDNGVYLPLTFNGSALVAEPLFRLRKGLYIGPRFQYRDVEVSLNREEYDPPPDVEPPPEILDILDDVAPDLLHQKTVSVGPRFQWDTRDDTYYPRKGIFLDFGADLFAEAIGSKYTYQYYKVAFNKYMDVGQRDVIAVRGMGCAAAGDHVPIYDLCLYGNGSDLRGYPGGRYQDRRMFATQVEYRLNMPPKKILGRLGFVAFGGVGGVADEFSNMAWEDLLPAGGGGIRFRLTNKDRINFRVDYGVGRVGHTITMGIAEAF